MPLDDSHTQTQSSTPDFRSLPAGTERKQAFVGYLLPLVEAENNRIGAQRKALQCLFRKSQTFSASEQRWLQKLAGDYRVKGFSLDDKGTWQELLSKVDKLPPSLALAQGANESAWGTSRFAREGNNLFGLWCFNPGCGVVPLHRPEGATYEVASFTSIAGSVQAYMRTLNSHPGYRQLRDIRARQSPPQGEALAAGLVEYSARGTEYTAELQQMIRYNRWQQLDNPEVSQR
ncbi:glucosaminidase domain-containing protein [bacterium SCSIO 12696]|nr:glucosaminidase domain-containing protein [bacterium SCSIO 12696]